MHRIERWSDLSHDLPIVPTTVFQTEDAMKRIPITFLLPQIALTPQEAARAIGKSYTHVWRLTGKKLLRQNLDGNYPVQEVERYANQLRG